MIFSMYQAAALQSVAYVFQITGGIFRGCLAGSIIDQFQTIHITDQDP